MSRMPAYLANTACCSTANDRTVARTATRPISALLVVGAAVCASGQALATDTGPTADLRPCIALSAWPAQTPGQAEPPAAQRPQPEPQPTPQRGPSDALRKPVTERDLLDLIATLEAATGKTGTKPNVDLGSADRLRVVLDDVTTLLVMVDARETARKLETGGAVSAEAREWFKQRFTAIQTCVTGKYEGRGGAAGQRESLALVEKHRSKLQPLVLELGHWVPAEPPPGVTPPPGVASPPPAAERRR